MRIVAILGILVIAAINCAFIYYSSFLAVRGDWGGRDGIDRVRFWGFLWIALLSAIALAQCVRGKKSAALATAVLTLPTGYATVMVGMFMALVHRVATPTSSQMAALCAASGPRFVAMPSAPVRSIAYDWGREYAGYFANLKLHFGNRITSIELDNPFYSDQVEFVENITSSKSEGGAPSVRIIRGDRYGSHQVPAEESAADVTVTYKYIVGQDEVSKFTSEQGLIGYELRVVDNRTRQELAMLRYATDFKHLRACGATDGDMINVREFVLKATGIPSRNHSGP